MDELFTAESFQWLEIRAEHEQISDCLQDFNLGVSANMLLYYVHSLNKDNVTDTHSFSVLGKIVIKLEFLQIGNIGPLIQSRDFVLFL